MTPWFLSYLPFLWGEAGTLAKIVNKYYLCNCHYNSKVFYYLGQEQRRMLVASVLCCP